MKTFKQFLVEQTIDPLYVSRKLLNANELISWAKQEGFNTTIEPDDMHVTIVYSTSPIHWDCCGKRSDTITNDSGKRSIETFDGGATVLKITSPELTQRWQQFRDAGASWSFPDYQPHVTISYNGEKPRHKVKPYSGKLVFGPEIFEKVNTEKEFKES